MMGKGEERKCMGMASVAGKSKSREGILALHDAPCSCMAVNQVVDIVRSHLCTEQTYYSCAGTWLDRDKI